MRRGMALGALLPPQKPGKGSLEVQQLSVPSFFLCPISIELMRDPVTLSTGMTYDRVSIEKWLGSGHNTCPTTNQVLENQELTPNHTLRRLIQDWCVANKSHGVERIPTPKQPVEPEEVQRLLHSIARGYRLQESLKKLRSLAKESERNRKSIAEAGAAPILAGALTLGTDVAQFPTSSKEHMEACEEALGAVALLQLSDGDKKALAASKTLSCVCLLLTSGSLDAKVNAAEVVYSVCEVNECLKGTVGSVAGAIDGLMRLLKEDSYPRAVHAGLKCLLSLCVPRKNRLIAIECNAISVIVELLPNPEKRNTERAFALLELLANCAEGREAISSHALAVPMIVKSLLGVSDMATEHAVAALWVVLSYASNRTVINAALQAGAFTKLLMLLPSNCSQRAKHKARDTLKLLNEVYGSYTCRPDEGPEVSNKRALGQVRSRTGSL